MTKTSTLPPFEHTAALAYTLWFYLAFKASRIPDQDNIKRSPMNCLPTTVQRFYKFGVLKFKKVTCKELPNLISKVQIMFLC